MANHGSGSNGYVFSAATASGDAAAASSSKAAGDKGRVQDRHMPTSLSEQVNRLEILHKVVERFGVPVVLLGIVLWWARNDLIEPLLRAHFEFINTVTACQREHTEEIRVIADKIDELIEVTQKR